MSRRRNFDIPDSQTESSKYLPNGELLSDRLNSLRSADPTDLLVFEAGEDVGKECGRPNSIVIGKDDDVRRDFLDPPDHLQTLIGIGNGDDSNALRVDRICKFLEGAKHFLLRDDDDLLRLSNKPAPGSFLKLFASIDSGDDDRNVLFSNVGGVLRQRDRTICQGCGYPNEIPQVSIKPKPHWGQKALLRPRTLSVVITR